ncbi:hypothetical protein GLOIN_2v1737025 [Rhizophagus irregularis DAOM 181602=DAOM 197198]|uniref:Uncharacterized protein n=1 Tax=Rhizophagus irregularis (strain DAOM 181602 / DAOM 197198 / MUCL 43194) TaxID=747089 RepID=A0A2P4NXB4_RHIID|nr:hypothetical protein GLOIN_2v1737025 [Rhizophagus irregularis DAOM 181602=DAOM 197198]POG57785.1 hypothetical protein GLOIN_2v1737025 [Rhizophagus irregularis DAOM 181602=DAOM 197198]|eukprot:XP_025164651.1 hypothetical protein GLOIN_2v1737025 [Rhizophagus irregularis DAOM 181602=DAOM 197198]
MILFHQKKKVIKLFVISYFDIFVCVNNLDFFWASRPSYITYNKFSHFLYQGILR